MTINPKLLGFWQKAISEATLRIDTGKGDEGRKAGTRLRFRLYETRKEMERTKHDLAPAAKSVALLLREDAEGWHIIASNRDADVDKFLDSIEVVNDAEEPPPLE